MDNFMRIAVEEACAGLESGGIPIGSCLVHVPSGKILGRGHNKRIQQGSAIRHGEMDALEAAGRLPAKIYRESVIYTTLSPCPMCSGAIRLYGIPKVIIGENINFMGDEEVLKQHGVEISVLNDPECIRLMKEFAETHPSDWNEDIGIEDGKK